MWFKNLVIYRLPADWAVSAAELEEKLTTRTLQPCSPFEMLSRGWVAPSSTGRLVHTVNQQHLIALVSIRSCFRRRSFGKSLSSARKRSPRRTAFRWAAVRCAI